MPQDRNAPTRRSQGLLELPPRDQIQPQLQFAASMVESMAGDARAARRNAQQLIILVARARDIVLSLDEYLNSSPAIDGYARNPVTVTTLEELLTRVAFASHQEKTYTSLTVDSLRTWNENRSLISRTIEALHHPIFQPQEDDWELTRENASKFDDVIWTEQLEAGINEMVVALSTSPDGLAGPPSEFNPSGTDDGQGGVTTVSGLRARRKDILGCVELVRGIRQNPQALWKNDLDTRDTIIFSFMMCYLLLELASDTADPRRDRYFQPDVWQRMLHALQCMTEDLKSGECHPDPIEEKLVQLKSDLGLDAYFETLDTVSTNSTRQSQPRSNTTSSTDTLPDLGEDDKIVIEPMAMAHTKFSDDYIGEWTPVDGHSSRKVVIKVFRIANELDVVTSQVTPMIERRLTRHFTFLRTLAHARLTPVLGYLSSSNKIIPERYCLVSPYRSNGNLLEYIERKEPSSTEKLKLLQEAAEGLAYLHGREPPVAHLDMRPSNVLVDDAKQAELCDVGLDRILDQVSDSFSSSSGGFDLRYIAPEALLETPTDPPVDIYALGGIILAAMSGKEPYHGLKGARVVLTISQGIIPRREDYPIAGLTPAAEDALWALLFDCWKFVPESRPQASELHDRLGEIVKLIK